MVLHSRFRSAAAAVIVSAAVVGAVSAQSLGDLLEDRVEDQIRRQVEAALVDSLEQAIESDVERAIDTISDSASETLGDARHVASAPAIDFVAAVDGNGATVERDVWVVLASPAQWVRIEDQGFSIREHTRLDSLGLVLLRVDAPGDRHAARAALERALDTPGLQIDLNHVYRQESDASGGSGSVRDRPLRQSGVSVAIIDSALDTDHEALRDASIEQRDFVRYERPRPTAHGTAVASILIGQTADSDDSRLFAASVFFEDARGDSAATTESLVQALDWAASTGAPVINMSLSGPANRVLEATIKHVIARGVVVVAAVGNDGPAGRPLYPAAHDGVVGVTAVDERNRVYRYANRGRQVMFAAPGVKVAVARSGGAYGTKSGTSMAAPYAAAIIAHALAASAQSPDRVLAALQAEALDLGDAGFDETYGFGRIVASD